MEQPSREIPSLIRCPLSGRPLAWLEPQRLHCLNAAIQENRVYDRLGRLVTEPWADAVTDVAAEWVYPVEPPVFCLLAETAVAWKDVDTDQP